jgi:hypothetical protein
MADDATAGNVPARVTERPVKVSRFASPRWPRNRQRSGRAQDQRYGDIKVIEVGEVQRIENADRSAWRNGDENGAAQQQNPADDSHEHGRQPAGPTL